MDSLRDTSWTRVTQNVIGAVIALIYGLLVPSLLANTVMPGTSRFRTHEGAGMTLPPNPTQSDLVRLSLLLCPSSVKQPPSSSSTHSNPR